MADTYIDAKETIIYGAFACAQMTDVCKGRVPELDPMVTFAIDAQSKADERMKLVLANQPKPSKEVNADEVLAEARDVVVRFGSHLDSLKGRPVNSKDVFDGDAPSILARRRLVKLTAAVGHIRGKVEQYKDSIRDVDLWRSELEASHEKLKALEKQQRSSKAEKVEMGPEVAAEREKWLATYSANKNLIRGLLGHVGKSELMPVIFDDLAEVHRVKGVSDEDGAGAPSPGKAEGSSEG